ncbi:MAG: helix-hairpin-helix domain-containing protein [Acidobacteriota bacterium]|nr:helix-hairpin-helix domain-containing protein [Acidobacteriota bacterium]
MDLDPTLLQKIAEESGASTKQVASTLDLLEKRSAIPFIARYRKEVTGNLDEPRIRRIAECHGRYRALLKRRRSILARIEDQGKLTEELRDRILACNDKTRLEDLYSPFKRKESKEASAAREKGLEPLAKKLWEQETGEFSVDAAAEEFLSEEKAVATREEAIEGALAIVAGWVADDAAIRGALRKLMVSDGVLVAKVVEGKEGEKSKYESFYDFREGISRIPFQRMTALRRGAREGILTLEIELDDQKALQLIKDKAIRQTDSPCVPHLEKAIRNAYFHSLKPLLQAAVRSNLKEKSENEALKLFQANLANLLLAPPVGSVPVIGIDPGARPACRIAVIDGNGGYREHATLAPGLPRKNSDRAEAILYRLIQRHGTHAIAIGNGVGSRETERFVKSFLAKYHSGHSFDLSLVRGKAARSDSPSKKGKTVNGQTASEPSAPGEQSPPPLTDAVEKPNPPQEDSPSASDGNDPAVVSDPVMQKSEGGIDSGSSPADPLSEDDPAPTASPSADSAASASAESSQQSGETVSLKPGDTETPPPAEAAPATAETQQASQDAVDPAPTASPSADSAPSASAESSQQSGETVSLKPGDTETPPPAEAAPATAETQQASQDAVDPAPTASPSADSAASASAESSQQSGKTVPSKPVDIETPSPTEAAPAPAETQQAPQDAEQSQRQPIFSAIVHKGGTAAYANSEAARKEFPRLDLGVRGAISIARRMQDPLSELAKIQPAAVVAGPDPHEVDRQRLKRKLNGTVESCINQVGVDVNTAPVEMLAHVAGLNTSLARSIVEYRRQHGPFSSRSQLMEVPGVTDNSFEQAAGFLRVPESEQPLDRTAVHPECYSLVEEMAGSVQATVAELMESPEKLKALDLEKLSNDRFGLPTLQDIRRELSRRGRDRRKAFVPPSFRADVKELSDLQKGMLVEGTVSNVTSFGAFVDIGVQQEGLVHISELSSRFVQDANQAVHVGQVIKAKVIGVDTDTNRISLSIKALRVRENSRKRKKKKPLKTDSRPSTPRPRHASTDGKGDYQEKRRSGRPERKPVGRKGRPGKKRQATALKTAAIQRHRTRTPEPEVLPDTSNLSFSEKIRLLQEKFSGIR